MHAVGGFFAWCERHQFLVLAAALMMPPMDLFPFALPANHPPDLPEEMIGFIPSYKPRTRADRRSGR
jgi:hypothetical protein